MDRDTGLRAAQQLPQKGNVLIIGESGVGKSTLVNAVLGEDRAETSCGTRGTTSELRLYENDRLPFRLVDTVGFEPTFLKSRIAINAVRSWSKQRAKTENKDSAINVIWFCVSGTKKKLFKKDIQDFLSAVSLWENVPIIAVITKSYSAPERAENTGMVKQAFAEQRGKKRRAPKRIIPVVAAMYMINETVVVPPSGIEELIEATNGLLPEGIKAGADAIYKYKLQRKRAWAQATVAAAAAAGVTIGAVPIPIADAALLGPTEVGELNVLAKIYGIKNDDQSKRFINSIIEVGTVSTAAKALISGLKAIPGINIGASALNAVIAGSIIIALGESAIAAFEKIYKGEKSTDDINWVQKLTESALLEKLSPEIMDRLKRLMESSGDNTDLKTVASKLVSLLGSFSDSGKRNR